MIWDRDHDVKEYHPKRTLLNKSGLFSADSLPSEFMKVKPGKLIGPLDGITALDGGAAMTTAEIIDFAGGADTLL